MPKYFVQPTKHLFGSLLLLTAQMLTAEGTCNAAQFFSLFFLKGGGREVGWVGVGEVLRRRDVRVYVYVCVYTQHAKIPQPDESYPGTCNTRLRRKFHILPYHRTSISSLVLDAFQESYNYYCYK